MEKTKKRKGERRGSVGRENREVRLKKVRKVGREEKREVRGSVGGRKESRWCKRDSEGGKIRRMMRGRGKKGVSSGTELEEKGREKGVNSNGIRSKGKRLKRESRRGTVEGGRKRVTEHRVRRVLLGKSGVIRKERRGSKESLQRNKGGEVSGRNTNGRSKGKKGMGVHRRRKGVGKGSKGRRKRSESWRRRLKRKGRKRTSRSDRTGEVHNGCRGKGDRSV